MADKPKTKAQLTAEQVANAETYYKDKDGVTTGVKNIDTEGIAEYDAKPGYTKVVKAKVKRRE
jgi:hypothetical protein